MEENEPLPQSPNMIKNIRTYSSDMADAVRENEASVIKIALAEQKRHEQEALYKKAEGTKGSKVVLFMSGLLIMALGVGGVYYIIQKNKVENTPPPQVSQKVEALISYDDQSFLDMSTATSQNDAIGIIQGDMEKAGKPGNIKALFVTDLVNGKAELMSVENFLSLMNVTAPLPLIRSLDAPYMMGTYQALDTAVVTPHLFLLFKTKDFNQSYAGMLAWEKTLLDDFFALFKIDVSGSRNALFEKPWKDIILANKDARILYDAVGNDVLYYMFIDKDTFIITDSKDTIQEVGTRLQAKKIKPL